MRRSASEVIRNLEMRIARLEKSSSESFSATFSYTLYDEDEMMITTGSFRDKLSLEDFESLSDEDMYLLPTRGGNSILVEQGRGRRGYLGYSFDISQKEDEDDILSSDTMHISIDFDRSVTQETINKIKKILDS